MVTANAQHTPGPWQIDARDHDGETLYELVSGDRPLGRIWGDNAVWLKEGEAFANAVLIKAAPDLLAALEELREVQSACHCGHPELCSRCHALRSTRDAIQKARGE